MNIKWVPDVHRPTGDFTARSNNFLFKIVTWNGNSELTTTIRFREEDDPQSTVALSFQAEYISVKSAKQAAVRIIKQFEKSCKEIGEKP